MTAIREAAAMLAGAGRAIRARALPFAALAAAGLLAAMALLPFDARLLHLLTDNDTRAMRDIARAISFWGDFLTGSLLLAAGLWLIGGIARALRRSGGGGGAPAARPSPWRAAALATLLASAAAGIAANCLRLTLGRPRPRAELPDGLYGPRIDHRYHAFPSGHSATAMGSAAALAVALPPAAAPAVGAALAVGWSRLYLKQHHPADVVAGFTFGAVAGIAFGLAARAKKDDG